MTNPEPQHGYPTVETPKEKVKDKLIFLRLSLQEQILFAKRLSLLIKAGVPLLKSLRMMRDQSTNKNAIHIYTHLTDHVANGSYLSVAMQKFHKIFGNFTISVIQIGEVSGTLQENLHYLGEELRKKQELRRKVRSALVYPVIILVATFVLALVLTVYVFPKVLPIFANLDFDLPWMTKVLIFTSDILIHQWWVVSLVIILLAVSAILSLRINKVRMLFDRYVFLTPAIGPLLKSYHLSNICRTLGVLLKSDAPIVKAVQVTNDTESNMAYKAHLVLLKDAVARGERLSATLQKDPYLFPVIATQMIAVGEDSGNLSQSLFFLAEMYEAEVDDRAKNLSTVLEPLLLIFVGLVVGFIAISIIMPIYQVTQHLKPK